jgi:ferritin
MLSERIQNEFNDQINAEMFSAYLYLQMAAWFETQNLDGMANWMKVQAQEEMAHAMKFYAHINQRGGTVTLRQIDEPPHAWDSPLAAFEAVLGHEQYITGRINKLLQVSNEENDYASKTMLQWFVDEQVEEEENATRNVEKTRMIQDHPGGLYMLDKELVGRTFNPPAEGEE